MRGDTDGQGQYANIPIPTYDEAVASRPSSSQDNGHRGPREVSDDAERQGLLGGQSNYHPPTVESNRSSTDTDLGLPEMDASAGADARRHIEEMDYLDPSSDDPDGLYQRPRLGRNISKRLANISAAFSSLHLPSFRSFYTSVPPGDDHDGPTAASPRHSRWPFGLSWPENYRLSASTIAKLCGLSSITILIYVVYVLDLFPGHNRRFSLRFDPEAVRGFILKTASSSNIADSLRYITSYDHVAGTEGDLFLARWMHEQWAETGGFDKLATLEYYVYLNYPTPDGRSVTITAPQDLRWKAALEETPVDASRKQTLAWHGHSKSGVALGPLVYANGGSREDFAWLTSQGIALNGTIALVRYYTTQGDRALKVKAAEEAGCLGVLIYSDPHEDGRSKGAVWPNGPWRPADSLQRGAVSLMSWVVGDPLTPGWASTKGAKRIDKESSAALVKIPSLPLAWRDAKVLIEALHGHGVEVPDNWVGGTSGGKWFSGAGVRANKDEAIPEVELRNLNDENERQRIWNVHGLIMGTEQQEKKIMVGNHRDAWCFGSVDPGSGSAVMMEVISIFGKLIRVGWRPLRTIEFSSWDAEEYNLVGSTEYVEDKIDFLREHGVAYLNVDVGVSGQKFRAAGAPSLRRSLVHALDRVVDPSDNGTLKQLWQKAGSKLEGLGAGSDYVAFQDMAGTSSIDFGFEGPEYGYPYHSCYETFEWMQKFGDPDFSYHTALAQVWALLILDLADTPIVPLDLIEYTSSIKTYIKRLQADVEDAIAAARGLSELSPEVFARDTHGLDLAPLREAANKAARQAEKFHHFEEIWSSNVLGSGGIESMNFAFQRLKYNERISHFDSDLLDLPETDDGGGDNDNENADDKDQHGVPGREQFKHIIFGPQTWSGYEEAYFPAVRDAVAAGDWKAAQRQVRKAARILERAGDKLVEGLSW